MGLQEALAGLLLPGPAHGYQLHATLESELGTVWETRPSHLYLTLGRMERDGLLMVRRVVRQESRPDRQVLELTAKGRAMGEHWLMSPEPESDMVVKLAVTRIVRPHQFVELVATISDDIAGRLKTLRVMSPSMRGGFQPQAIALEIARRQSEIRWLSAIRDNAAGVLAQPQGVRRRRRVDQASRLA